MAVKATNNAWGLLSTAMSAQTTTLVLQSGQSARFPLLGPNDWFYLTIFDTNGNVEIVKVTKTVGDTFTVVRGQDNTTAIGWASSVRVQLNLGVAMWADIATGFTTAAQTTRNFAAAITLSGAPSLALQAATMQYLSSNCLPKSTAIQAPIGFSPVRQSTGTGLYYGWNGADIYTQLIGSGVSWLVWRDNNFTPGNYANAAAQCVWNSGIYQAGALEFNPDGGSGTIDVGSPWVMEGYTGTESIDGSGRISALRVYPRLVYLRNQ